MTPEELRRPAVHHDGCVEIDVQEAMAILSTAPIRIEEMPADWSGGPWTHPHIYHQDRWKSLCRTDWCDDVATGWCTTKTAEEWRAHYLQKLTNMSYGARYNDNRFSIIDAATDG